MSDQKITTTRREALTFLQSLDPKSEEHKEIAKALREQSGDLDKRVTVTVKEGWASPDTKDGALTREWIAKSFGSYGYAGASTGDFAAVKPLTLRD
jgi:hypothetical protein